MRAWYFCDGVCLPNDEEVLNIPDEVFCVSFDSVFDDEEVGVVGFLPKQWRTNEVVV